MKRMQTIITWGVADLATPVATGGNRWTVPAEKNLKLYTVKFQIKASIQIMTLSQ